MPSGAYAAAYFAVHAMIDADVPINGGCFRPISLKLPERSILNPEEPAAVNARTSTMKRVAGCITSALGKADPPRAVADAAGELLLLAFGAKEKMAHVMLLASWLLLEAVRVRVWTVLM